MDQILLGLSAYCPWQSEHTYIKKLQIAMSRPDRIFLSIQPSVNIVLLHVYSTSKQAVEESAWCVLC